MEKFLGWFKPQETAKGENKDDLKLIDYLRELEKEEEKRHNRFVPVGTSVGVAIPEGGNKERIKRRAGRLRRSRSDSGKLIRKKY